MHFLCAVDSQRGFAAGHGSGDTFVKKAHSERLYEKYAGDKNFVT